MSPSSGSIFPFPYCCSQISSLSSICHLCSSLPFFSVLPSCSPNYFSPSTSSNSSFFLLFHLPTPTSSLTLPPSLLSSISSYLHILVCFPTSCELPSPALRLKHPSHYHPHPSVLKLLFPLPLQVPFLLFLVFLLSLSQLLSLLILLF